MILVIGAGNMGKTYIESLISNHAITKDLLYILEKDPKKIKKLKEKGFANIESEVGNFVGQMDTIILAIKPQHCRPLLKALRPLVSDHQIIISIMAGVRIKTIQEALGIGKIVRAMPNLPAQIGLGMTGFCVSDGIDKDEILQIQNMLNTTGKSLYFEDESQLDAVTAISGSGPAYVFYFMKIIRQSALELGFSPSQADVLVEQTFMGAVHLFGSQHLSSTEWIERVASKGGTTEAGIQHFEDRELSQIVHEGILKAWERAQELGDHKS